MERLDADIKTIARMSKHRYEVISRHITAIGSTLNGIIEAVKAGTWKPDK